MTEWTPREGIKTNAGPKLRWKGEIEGKAATFGLEWHKIGKRGKFCGGYCQQWC